jgi:ferredoxin
MASTAIYYKVTLEETGESYRCSSKESLLAGMERLGKKGIPVGCRGGGCGVCKVAIVSGTYEKRVMSRAYISVEEEANGIVMACRVRPAGDVVLRVLGKMKKNVCREEGALVQA